MLLEWRKGGQVVELRYFGGLSSGSRERLLMMLSVIPWLRYSISGSPLVLGDFLRIQAFAALRPWFVPEGETMAAPRNQPEAGRMTPERWQQMRGTAPKGWSTLPASAAPTPTEAV